ncbi:MAG: spore coat associated protein CotJA [Carboxydocellales bacterium]
MSSRHHKHEKHKYECPNPEDFQHLGENSQGFKPIPLPHPIQIPQQMPQHLPPQMLPVQPVTTLRLAEATVPYQVYMQIWDPRTALRSGTVFPELYRPYK